MLSCKDGAKQQGMFLAKGTIHGFLVDSLNAEGRQIHFVDIINKTHDSLNIKLVKNYVSFRLDSIYRKMMQHAWGIILLSQDFANVAYKIEVYPVDSCKQKVSAVYFQPLYDSFSFYSNDTSPDSIYIFFEKIKTAVPDTIGKSGWLIDGESEIICYDGEIFYHLNSFNQKTCFNEFIVFLISEYKTGFEEIAKLKERKYKNYKQLSKE